MDFRKRAIAINALLFGTDAKGRVDIIEAFGRECWNAMMDEAGIYY